MEITNEELLNKYIGSYVVAIEDLSPAPPQETRLRAREAHNKFHDELLQRLNRQNANLAGMEPRCPKCENLNFSVAMVGRDNQIGTCGKCDCNLPVAQFFRSPAPTPPNLYQIFKHKDGCTWLTELPTGVGTWGCSCGLDKLLLELEDYELTAPTPPLDVEARELEEAWSMLVERGVRIYTLSTALIDRDAYARTERAITQLLSLLRRHIASPAPQPLEVDEVDDRLEVLYEAEEMEPVRKWRINFKLPDGARIALVNFYSAAQAMAQIRGMLLHAKRESPAASPAQPEKRDEWVSVDERTPELSGEYIVCFASGTISGNCHWNVSTKAWGNNRDGSSWNITHWQPLPAPPQRGKEGQ